MQLTSGRRLFVLLAHQEPSVHPQGQEPRLARASNSGTLLGPEGSEMNLRTVYPYEPIGFRWSGIELRRYRSYFENFTVDASILLEITSY